MKLLLGGLITPRLVNHFKNLWC